MFNLKKLYTSIVFSILISSDLCDFYNTVKAVNFDNTMAILNTIGSRNLDNSLAYKRLSEKISKLNRNVFEEPDKFVIPCGTPFGIKMFSSGSLIVGISDVQTLLSLKNPAREAGLRKGDIIKKVNDVEIDGNLSLAKAIESSNGEKVKICVTRGKDDFEVVLNPVKSIDDDEFKIGVWVRSSSAGIGTMTFYNPKTKIFSGLGHGIYDSDTENLFPLESGEIVDTAIVNVIPGRGGCPGELKGSFTSKEPIGKIFDNSECGVYGVLNKEPVEKSRDSAVKIASKNEIKIGKAQILTTLSGNKPEYYDINIENINTNSEPTKNISFIVTDKKLLERTGGILQGMSGSPILQNGKLLGAVTHVVINNPKKGYGIFAEKMFHESANILNLNSIAAC